MRVIKLPVCELQAEQLANCELQMEQFASCEVQLDQSVNYNLCFKQYSRCESCKSVHYYFKPANKTK